MGNGRHSTTSRLAFNIQPLRSSQQCTFILSTPIKLRYLRDLSTSSARTSRWNNSQLFSFWGTVFYRISEQCSKALIRIQHLQENPNTKIGLRSFHYIMLEHRRNRLKKSNNGKLSFEEKILNRVYLIVWASIRTEI